MKLSYLVESEESVKLVLKNRLHLSKRLIKKLKDNKLITKNGKNVSVNVIAKVGEIIEADINFEEECDNIVATQMPLDIVYEDEAYIVLNKQPKIETHPTCANYSNTLANGLKYYFEQHGIKKKIRPVNRLDKETSGIIIFAKNEYVQEHMIRQMKDGIFKKEYIAMVEGVMEKEAGVIDVPIKRKEGSILERCVALDGDVAITEYEVLERLQKMTVVRCKLRTGRTHQIRVHMQFIGHPIVSDFLYGKRCECIDRQALHSYKVQFLHPLNNFFSEYEAPLPADMQNLIFANG